MAFNEVTKKFLYKLGYRIHRTPAVKQSIPDASFYTPLFSPWLGYGEFKEYFETARGFTLISPDRLYILYTLALQSINWDCHWYECGVYKGGSAMFLAKLLSEKGKKKRTKLHLFDTFEGMPGTDPQKDIHQKGDFSDTSLESVKSRVLSLVSDPSIVEFHKGLIPETFRNLESHRISFSHVDVDIYQSAIACCNFIYPRLQNGGFMVFDDYGFPSCPGARKAVDEFFEDKPEVPLVLPTGQAVVFRGSRET